MKPKIGLVLTGGGARAAYQAGVLYGISEFSPKHGVFPFPIITGISAGSINAAFLACCDADFHETTDKLWKIWASLESKNIFSQTKTCFAWAALRLLINVFLAERIFKLKWPDSLLDNSPLRDLLEKNIDLHGVEARIVRGDLLGVAFSATNFLSKATTTFFEAKASIKPWHTKDSCGVKTKLSTKHVLASSAIPGIFRLEKIDDFFYGDGSTRVAFPISPALHLSADKIFAIDMRHYQSLETRQSQCKSIYPPLGEICASLLDSIFSDSLDRDLERLDLVNQFVKRCPENSSSHKDVPYLLIRPSKDLGILAGDIFNALSFHMRKILKAFAITPETSADLISHLAFENVYTKKLLELGRADAHAHKRAITNFLEI